MVTALVHVKPADVREGVAQIGMVLRGVAFDHFQSTQGQRQGLGIITFQSLLFRQGVQGADNSWIFQLMLFSDLDHLPVMKAGFLYIAQLLVRLGQDFVTLEQVRMAVAQLFAVDIQGFLEVLRRALIIAPSPIDVTQRIQKFEHCRAPMAGVPIPGDLQAFPV